jgi:gluconokinase
VRGAGDRAVAPPHGAVSAIVVMGVPGCGKSTIGGALARRLGWRFVEGDALHSAANVEKMRAGVPLDDDDRAPWLARLNAMLRDSAAAGRPVVLACSALRQRYRDALAEGMPGLRFVHLTGSPELITARLATRRHPYMPATLLASQLATLEPPAVALTLDINAPIDALVEAIVEKLAL